MIFITFTVFEGATKLNFVYYSRVVSILFLTDLYKSRFSTYSFGKTRFSSFAFLYLRLLIFSFALYFEFHVFLNDLITFYKQGIEFIRYLLILFLLYSNYLLKYKNCIIKTCFQRGSEFVKKNFICKEKFGTVFKVKLVAKIKKFNQLYFGIWYYHHIVIVEITHKNGLLSKHWFQRKRQHGASKLSE